MEQLSGVDSFTLHPERGNAFNHVAALAFHYDPATAPGGKVRFKAILDRIEGLAPGSFARFVKFRHASVDRVAAMDVTTRLHADTPALARAAKPAVAGEHAAQRKPRKRVAA